MLHLICDQCGDEVYYKSMELAIVEGWMSFIEVVEEKPCFLCPFCSKRIDDNTSPQPQEQSDE